MEKGTERDSENWREEGNCRKRGSLARHYPQSNPQFKVRGNTERETREEEENQTVKEQLKMKNIPSLVYIVSNDILSNFSPSVQLSTSGLFTLAGSAERAHCTVMDHTSYLLTHLA